MINVEIPANIPCNNNLNIREEASFKHVFREADFTAEAIASLGHGLAPLHLGEHELSLSCSIPFYFDLVGSACTRGFRL